MTRWGIAAGDASVLSPDAYGLMHVDYVRFNILTRIFRHITTSTKETDGDQQQHADTFSVQFIFFFCMDCTPRVSVVSEFPDVSGSLLHDVSAFGYSSHRDWFFEKDESHELHHHMGGIPHESPYFVDEDSSHELHHHMGGISHENPYFVDEFDDDYDDEVRAEARSLVFEPRRVHLEPQRVHLELQRVHLEPQGVPSWSKVRP